MHTRAERSLSPRQAEIADLVKSGKTSRQIGELLFIDPRTVDSHIDAICNKLGVRTRVELVVALFGPDEDTDSGKTNLPLQRTRLIGRETEIADILDLIADSRIVTITGSGGVGKTRAAIAIGDTLLNSAKDGVWLVDLGPLAQGSFVTASVAAALSVRESPVRPLIETLTAQVKKKALLLILDNCEHVTAEAGVLAEALLSSCPHLRILATSRESLRIAGEQTYRLPSLRVPSPQETLELGAAAAAGYAAVELFAERARGTDRGFALSDDNAPIVAEICRRLDGIPLAIELAAARVNVLPIRTLSTKLDQRLRILTGGDRTALPRHQTMRALIDWSYDLLSEGERALFRRLSIFAGGFTHETAIAICGEARRDESGVLHLLSSLVDKSLVQAEPAAGDKRYRLLESTRVYAREKLVERGEQASVARAHAAAYLALAERLVEDFETIPERLWLARVEPELENWRAALACTITDRVDVLLGQRLAGALTIAYGSLAANEGRQWVGAAREAIDAATPRAVVAKLDLAEARLGGVLGRFKDSYGAAERALQHYREFNDQRGIADAQRHIGRALVFMGRASDGATALEEALTAARALGERKLSAVVLHDVGVAQKYRTNLPGARVCFSESQAIFSALGCDREAAIVASNLADVEFQSGDVPKALRLASEALAGLSERSITLGSVMTLSNTAAYCVALDYYAEARSHAREALALAHDAQYSLHIFVALQHLAAVAALRPSTTFESTHRDRARAARIFGYIDANWAAFESPREYTEMQEWTRVQQALSEALKEPGLTTSVDEGRLWSEDQAVAEALLV